MVKNKAELKDKLKGLIAMDSCSFIVVRGDHDMCEQACREAVSELNRQMVHFKQGVHNLANDIYGFKVNGNYCQSPFTRACAYGQIVLISRADQSDYKVLNAIKPAIDHGHYFEGSEIIYDTVRDEDGSTRAVCVNMTQDMKPVSPGFKVIASVSNMEWMHRWGSNLMDLVFYINAQGIESESL